MIIKLPLFLLSVFCLKAAASQDSTHLSLKESNTSTIDSTIAAIDRSVSTAVNIKEYVRPMFADDGGGIFLNHRYTIDSSKRIFHKAVYDYVGSGQVTFYYNNNKIIKAIASDTSLKGSRYKCEYYFVNDSIFSIKEHGVPDSKYVWSKQMVTSQAKKYLIDFSAICDMLDKRK